MGRRLDLDRQISSDVYYALRCVEENNLSDAEASQLLKISSLAGELVKALNDSFGCPAVDDDLAPSDPATATHTARNEGRSPSE
jgi:hypothetical protein